MADELVERARQGDREAFEALATRLVNRLYATAVLIIRDADAAADAAQETIIEIWRRLPSLRDADAFDAWMHRILVRRCYVAVGRRRRLVEIRRGDIDTPVPSHEAHVDTVDQIERAFRRLTADQRAILVLSHRLGYADAETAQILGVPVGTVKSRLNRARAALRASVEADERALTSMKGQPA